jgi:hypothetical protein
VSCTRNAIAAPEPLADCMPHSTCSHSTCSHGTSGSTAGVIDALPRLSDDRSGATLSPHPETPTCSAKARMVEPPQRRVARGVRPRADGYGQPAIPQVQPEPARRLHSWPFGFQWWFSVRGVRHLSAGQCRHQLDSQERGPRSSNTHGSLAQPVENPESRLVTRMDRGEGHQSVEPTPTRRRSATSDRSHAKKTGND